MALSDENGAETEDAPVSAAQVTAPLRRRTFIKQTAAIVGVAGTAGYVSLAPSSWPLSLRDPDGEVGKPKPNLIRLPENGYAVEALATDSDLGIARGTDIRGMVRASVDAIGGIARYVKRGDVVLIKPNVAFERSAPLGATTNPEIMVELIELVRDAGASEIRVADNPIESPEACFARTGIRQAAVDAGARVYLPSPGDFETLNVPGAKWIEQWPFFWRPFRGVDKVIGVAPVKDHNLCRASMTTKNWYGLLGGRRNQFHQDIHGIISDLALMMKPTFVLLDGTRVLFRSGPTGGSLSDVRAGKTIVAARDTLAADSFGWDDLLQRKGEELPGYFPQAAQRSLGDPNWKERKIKEVQVG
ncbi:MAG: DUF362 domain-containing protein [Myxococcota bacterium]